MTELHSIADWLAENNFSGWKGYTLELNSMCQWVLRVYGPMVTDSELIQLKRVPGPWVEVPTTGSWAAELTTPEGVRCEILILGARSRCEKYLRLENTNADHRSDSPESRTENPPTQG